MDQKTIEALQSGMRFVVEPDPEDERYTRMTFRRLRTPKDVDRDYNGQQAMLKYLKHGAAMLQGSGLMELHRTEDGNRLLGIVDMSALLMLSEGAEDGGEPS